MLKLKIGYPSRAEERQILDLMARTIEPPQRTPVVIRSKSWRRGRSSTTFTSMTK